MKWHWMHAPDDVGADRAAAELAHSDRLLQEAKVNVILPLRKIRERNNVTALVRILLKRQVEKRGPGTSGI